MWRIKSRVDKENDIEIYLEKIALKIEMLKNDLKIIFSRDYITDNDIKSILIEAAKTAETIFNHIFNILLLYITKLKKKIDKDIQNLAEKAAKVLAILKDVFYSFVKVLEEFGKKN